MKISVIMEEVFLPSAERRLCSFRVKSFLFFGFFKESIWLLRFFVVFCRSEKWKPDGKNYENIINIQEIFPGKSVKM